jgi:uncharacterized protein with FMN-binding domain
VADLLKYGHIEMKETEMANKISRRDFLKGVGAAAAAAGLGGVLAGCTTSGSSGKPASGAVYTPGTYSAGADGISSKVTVTMTFDETSITDVKVDASGETASIGGAAAEDLQKAILDSQSADIDAVSGATITSQAAMKAAANCIAQAKGEAAAASGSLITDGSDEDWLGEEPVVDEQDIDDTVDTDIVIVGAGNGGMAAAAYAAANGLKFRVVEQNSVVQDTRHWYGAINSSAAKAAGSSVNTHLLLSEISRYASGKANQRVVKTWIDESAAMHDFVSGILESDPYNMTCEFTSGEEARWPEDPNNTQFYFSEQEHNYRASEAKLKKERNQIFLEYIQSKGYDVDFNRSLVKLEKDDSGKITGIIAESTEDGSLIRYNAAKGVLLACGGYPGNPYMMQQLDPLGSSVTTAVSFSPADKGYGIRAAVWAGANLDREPAPMLFDRGLVAPGVDAGYVDSESSFGGKEFPGTVRQYNPGTQPFLKVNRHGIRFANESSPYNDISYAAAHQPGHVYAQIMDANWKEDVKRFHTIGCSAQTRNDTDRMEKLIDGYVEDGLIMKADTLEDLADQLGFKDEDKENFLNTVNRYNELADKGDDEDFGKMSVRLSHLNTAPYYGCWLGASLLTTEQGIEIDEYTRALDADKKPIEGLYITGDMSGSFFANNYPCLLPGVACGRTMTFAIKAIKQMGGLEEKAA